MIIRLEPFKNGAHANQSTTPPEIPEGWVKVPESVKIPDSFPYVDVVLDESGAVAELVPGNAMDIAVKPAQEDKGQVPAE